MKYLIFLTLIFGNILNSQAQNDTIYLKPIEVSDSKTSFENFSKKINKKKLISPKQASFKIKIEEKNFEGEIFFNSNFKIDTISSKNEKIKTINQEIIKVAFTSWYVIHKNTIENFICQQIDEQNWQFSSHKEDKKINLNGLDNFSMGIELSKEGILTKSTLHLKPQEGNAYQMIINFRIFQNKIAFQSIEAQMPEKNIFVVMKF